MTRYAPDSDCSLCPRLSDFRAANRLKFPDKFNAPVPSFGPEDTELLIVGLAPGLKGANFSGRPFTGDYAGDLLYCTLLKFGFAQGTYGAHAQDGLRLENCRITNAVRCVPPENKPTGEEINECLGFFRHELKNLKKLRVILSLGLIAHNSVLKAHDLKISRYKFAHGRIHELPGDRLMVNSYHCSRYNTQTRRLTTEMFEDFFALIQTTLQPR